MAHSEFAPHNGLTETQIFEHYQINNLGTSSNQYSVSLSTLNHWALDENFLLYVSTLSDQYILFLCDQHPVVFVAIDLGPYSEPFLFQKRANAIMMQVFLTTEKFRYLFLSIFTRSWSSYTQRFDTCNLVEKSILFVNIRHFLGFLLRYPLLRRYVWRHKTLWKRLLKFVLKILMDRDLRILDEAALYTMLSIFGLMRFTRECHVQYLFDHGLVDGIVNVAEKCWSQMGYEFTVTNQRLPDYPPKQQSFCYTHVFRRAPISEPFKILNMILRLRRGALLKNQQHLRKWLGENAYFKELEEIPVNKNDEHYDAFFRTFVFLQVTDDPEDVEAFLRSKNVVLGTSLCEWRDCSHTECTAKLYRRKGCKLVAYCSRAHHS